MSLRGQKPEAIQLLPIYKGRKLDELKKSEMSDFGNKNVRSFALFVPIIALKSYCWASMPNLQTFLYIK